MAAALNERRENIKAHLAERDGYFASEMSPSRSAETCLAGRTKTNNAA